jgi:hypothetical protein
MTAFGGSVVVTAVDVTAAVVETAVVVTVGALVVGAGATLFVAFERTSLVVFRGFVAAAERESSPPRRSVGNTARNVAAIRDF